MRWIGAFEPKGVFLSRDWHTADNTDHMGPGKWPVHCIQNTPGAEFHDGLRIPKTAKIISKGTGRTNDGYSAFEGSDERGIQLGDCLKEIGVRGVVVAGLATDYCVRATVESARKSGLKVEVVEDAIRAVNPETGERAKKEMIEWGAIFTDTETILSRRRVKI
jgi:nicotinamidase/pyrazinamidase